MIKLVTVAMWSNFSAQSPAIIPKAPREKADKKVKAIKVVKFLISKSINR